MENTTGEVSWNLSQLMIIDIAEHLKSASNNYIKQRYDQTFLHLKAIKMRIVPYLSLEEIKNLDTQESPILILWGSAGTRAGFNPVNIQQRVAFHKLWKAIDKYNNDILSYLKKYGMLIPMKADTTKMNA